MAHDRADILAYQAGSGARGRRTETAQTTGVAECGNCDAPESLSELALVPRSIGAGLGADPCGAFRLQRGVISGWHWCLGAIGARHQAEDSASHSTILIYVAHDEPESDTLVQRRHRPVQAAHLPLDPTESTSML